MNFPPRKNAVLLGLVLALSVASICAYFFLSGPPRASASDEAVKAADELVQQQGGGEQPRDANGVPRDAVVDPNNKPGRIIASPK